MEAAQQAIYERYFETSNTLYQQLLNNTITLDEFKLKMAFVEGERDGSLKALESNRNTNIHITSDLIRILKNGYSNDL